MLFNVMIPCREGLTSLDQYQYLAPDPSGNTWSADTITQFTAKYNTVNDLSGNKAIDSSDFSAGSFFTENATEQEAQYYVQNGKWPYDSYVTTNLIPTIQKKFPNRFVYAMAIGSSEANMNPQPVSYKIFSGTTPDPSASTSGTLSKVDTTTSTQTVTPTKQATAQKLGFSI
jgi:hypothetical protein